MRLLEDIKSGLKNWTDEYYWVQISLFLVVAIAIIFGILLAVLGISSNYSIPVSFILVFFFGGSIRQRKITEERRKKEQSWRTKLADEERKARFDFKLSFGERTFADSLNLPSVLKHFERNNGKHGFYFAHWSDFDDAIGHASSPGGDRKLYLAKKGDCYKIGIGKNARVQQWKSKKWIIVSIIETSNYEYLEEELLAFYKSTGGCPHPNPPTQDGRTETVQASHLSLYEFAEEAFVFLRTNSTRQSMRWELEH